MKILGNFRKSVSGTAAVTFAMLVVPLMLGAGALVDISRISSASSQIQEATDAAALAAATFIGTNSQKITEGENYFQANMYADVSQFNPVISINISAQGVITASANGMYPTSFMAVAGYGEHQISGFAKVAMSGLGESEIVFVLDYSSSMNDQYEAMRDAVINMIGEITDNQTSTEVKIGLVPFAHEVFASMDGKYVNGGTTGVTWSNCTIDRKSPWNLSDTAPNSTSDSKWGLLGDHAYSDVANSGYYTDCAPYIANNLVIRPLTTSHNGTVAQLTAMTPHVGTNITLGMQFGYQLVSPNPPWSEAVSYNNSAWSKYIILLSDGSQHAYGFGPFNSYSLIEANNNLAQVCNNAKAKGITIITVAYELSDPDGKAALEACASSSQYYLEGTEQNISTVFDSIGNLLSAGAYLAE